jgi:hypothetical protein
VITCPVCGQRVRDRDVARHGIRHRDLQREARWRADPEHLAVLARVGRKPDEPLPDDPTKYPWQ